MVKFSRQLEAQLIPEWKDAFVNYRQLKKNVKKIKLSHPLQPSSPSMVTSTAASDFSGSGRMIPPVIDRFFSSFFQRHNHRRRHTSNLVDDDLEQFQMELVHSREQEVKHFFEKLDRELEKVNRFYEAKEADFIERGEVLEKQLQILIDLKRILHDRRQRFRKTLNSSSSDVEDSVSNFSESATECEDPEAPDDDLVAALERNGVTFINSSARSKAKKGGKPRTTSMRIDIPPTNPTKTISAVTSMIWEDVVNSSAKSPKKEGGDYITRKKIQCAEKMIRGAFIELYRGLGLLNTYNSLNMMAFRKILKKFDKVSGQQESGSYLRKVRRSHFASSDKVVRLGDEVEITFTKHFANSDRKKAMKFLRPQQPKESHAITFFVGLFTGSFVSLFIMYAILAHLAGIFSTSNVSGDTKDGGGLYYLEVLYPIFSMFSLLSLHIFLYGCNLYAWKDTRINYNFIFEFSPNTALKSRDAFLISAVLMTVVISAMVIHILLLSAVISIHHISFIPGVVFLIFTLVLFCPFNICYRSTRCCFLRIIRNIILSPFYRVLMADFFMADQLTSQIPLMRHMEFTACFFMAGGFRTNPYNTCSNDRYFKIFSYIISFLPYYWRAMQCLRRYMEEGYDLNHIANAGKYISAMVSAAARIKYVLSPTPFWLFVVVATSSAATMYQCYWDFVKDWGFFCNKSRNRFLRDDLILKNKAIYYVSIIINFVLRLAWIQTINSMNLGQVEHRLLEFLMASLEVIRRGHWNYYRLENEHLNNVGKFRAVKAVPLPFREMDSDD